MSRPKFAGPEAEQPGTPYPPRPQRVFASGGTMGTKLYVCNLPFSVTSQELTDLFSQAVELVSANFITDRFSGQSRGFGFVEMSSDDAAQAAIQQFNDYQMKGRGLKVNEAKPRENRGGGGGARDRDRDRRGGGGAGRPADPT